MKLLILFLTIFLVGSLTKCTTKLQTYQSNDTLSHALQLTDNVFLKNAGIKTFVPPPFKDFAVSSSPASDSIEVDPSKAYQNISPLLFGTNSNTFSGQMVNEPELLENIRILNPGLIRYPGGDISDTYFWNQQKDKLPADVPSKVFVSKGDSTSSQFWYGKNSETWTLSLDNYYLILKSTGAGGLITVNYGYARYGTSVNPVQAAAHLAADWVRYDKGRTIFWEVGNEDYGYWEAGWKIDKSINQDGQPEITNGSLYGKHFKVFCDSMRSAAAEIGTSIRIGAQLVCKKDAPDNPAAADWNSGYFSSAADAADFYVIHNYYSNYGENSSVQTILNSATIETVAIENYLAQSFASSGRKLKPLALTEWNIFSVGANQRVSQIAGVHAVLSLGEMVKAGISMATRFDLVGKFNNGNDFGTFSIGDEPDNSLRWNPRPVFYYLYYFAHMIGDQMISSVIKGSNDIVCYASRYRTGNAVGTIVVNKSNRERVVLINILNSANLKNYYYYILSGSDNQDFSRKVSINGVGPVTASGGPPSYQTANAYRSPVAEGIKINLPKYSVAFMVTASQ